MTDIVITYLNSKRSKWVKSCNSYKQKELKTGAADISNRQAFGAERFRDWNNLHYWFRGVENCCPWANKIFLIVQSKDQLPNWLNLKNPKLRVVTHDEFIPKKLLPTFNPFTIELYFHRIKDLGEQYIYCNDDQFFMSPIKETMFFENGRPKQPENRFGWELYRTNSSDGVFYQVLNNNRLLLKDEIKKLYPTKEPWVYGFTHLPYPRLKSFDKQVFDMYGNKFEEGASYSKFRNPHNYCATIYDDFLKLYNKTIIDNKMFQKSAFLSIKSTTNLNLYKNCDVCCFNDTEQLDDFESTQRQLNNLLNRKFPIKSSFEKK